MGERKIKCRDLEGKEASIVVRPPQTNIGVCTLTLSTDNGAVSLRPDEIRELVRQLIEAL